MPAIASQLSIQFTSAPQKYGGGNWGGTTSASPHTQNLPWFFQSFIRSLKAKWIFNLNLNQALLVQSTTHQYFLASLKRNASHSVSRVQTPRWPRVSMILLVFGVGQFIHACRIVSIPVSSPHITDTLHVSLWIKPKCLQTSPNPPLGWEIQHYFQQKTFTAASAPNEFPCSVAHGILSWLTTHTLQMYLAACGYVSTKVCDETPILARMMGWDLS